MPIKTVYYLEGSEIEVDGKTALAMSDHAYEIDQAVCGPNLESYRVEKAEFVEESGERFQRVDLITEDEYLKRNNIGLGD